MSIPSTTAASLIRPVILCGGSGTRLWPVSREAFPKQFLRITADQSLLQQTAARLGGQGFERALIVSGEEQRFFVKRQLELAGVPAEAILLEPQGRNTATAAAFAAAWSARSGLDEMLLIMPSDHVIGDVDAFGKAVAAGMPMARDGAIVTFGATPTHANTQYGYIEATTDNSLASGVFPITRFVEKPDADKAAQFVASGRFFWNAGIFLAKASTVLNELREFLPGSLDLIERAVRGGTSDGAFFRPEPELFKRAENISFDNGVMEKTTRGVIVPVDMQWSDVGSWDSVWQLGSKDADDNVEVGEVVAVDTRNSYLRSEDGPLIAALGLQGMAVVAVRDAVLVAPLDRVADLKQIVARLKAQKSDRVASPAKVSRLWGSSEAVAEGSRYRVKHIVVDAGETLSLQMHHRRSEHWVVVRGSAEIIVGDKIAILEEGESTFIPAGMKHRLANRREVPLEIIEIQCGQDLADDDILRFEDERGA